MVIGLHIWNELTQTAERQDGYANMVGNVDRLFRPVGGGLVAVHKLTQERPVRPLVLSQVQLSLSHFNSGSAETPVLLFPLIALQYHEVKINLEFKFSKNVLVTSQLPLQPLP